jgi:surface polysaccharide O-acyltransferase-like enzyme
MSCESISGFEGLQNISDIVIVVGIIILSMTIGITNTSEGLYGNIIGYGFLSAGFIIKSAVLNSLSNCIDSNKKGLTFFFYSVLPFIIVAFIIVLIIIMLVTYFNRIVGGKVSSDFYMFSRMFVVITIAQLVIFYNGTSDDYYKKNNVLKAAYGMSIYLFSLINILILISLYIILAFYTTDG